MLNLRHSIDIPPDVLNWARGLVVALILCKQLVTFVQCGFIVADDLVQRLHVTAQEISRPGPMLAKR